MSQYDELDSRIIASVAARRNPLYDRNVVAEADRLAKLTGREDFRVIDGRLQALRRARRIVHRTKAESNGRGGWHLA